VDVQIAIEPEDVPAELYRLSDAYLDAAENLNAQILRDDWESSYQRGQVVLFLAFHAVELCLKACIKTAEPSENPSYHTLPKLAEQLNTLVPDLNYRVPFRAEPVSPPTPELRAKMEADARVAHQQLRYPADKTGNPWQGVFGFSARLFQGTLEDIRSELLRIRDHVAKHHDG